MRKEKQIEEMGFLILENCPLSKISSEDLAEILYDEGYRKQSVGEWIEKYKVVSYLHDDVEVLYECFRCGGNCCGTPHYCPNCGAKMKGV